MVIVQRELGTVTLKYIVTHNTSILQIKFYRIDIYLHEIYNCFVKMPISCGKINGKVD
jgi:hypothetical protein